VQRLRLSAFLILAWPALARAQRTSGAGISGGFGPSSSSDYVHIRWGPPDSMQLVATVFWRGSTDWGALGPEDFQWSQRASDSASHAAVSRGNTSGGAITRRARAWVEYDERRSVVFVLNQQWRVPRRDSALVLLVDRIDGVGGNPVISTVMIPVSPVPDSGGNVDASFAHWDRALRANDRVRAFMDDPYLALHVAYADSAAGRRRALHGDSIVFIAADPVLSDDDFANVEARAGPHNTTYLQVTCQPDACTRLASATSRNVGGRLAVLMRSRVRSVSRIASAIGARPMFTIAIDADSTEAGQILRELQARWPRDRKPPP